MCHQRLASVRSGQGDGSFWTARLVCVLAVNTRQQWTHCALQGCSLRSPLVTCKKGPSIIWLQPPPLPATQCKFWPERPRAQSSPDTRQGSSSLVIMCTVRIYQTHTWQSCPLFWRNILNKESKGPHCVSCKRTFFIDVVWRETESGVIQTIHRMLRRADSRLQTPDIDRTRFCQTDKWIFSLHDVLREVIILYFLPPCAKSNELLNYLILSLFNVSSQVFAKWKGRTVFISSA